MFLCIGVFTECEIIDIERIIGEAGVNELIMHHSTESEHKARMYLQCHLSLPNFCLETSNNSNPGLYPTTIGFRTRCEWPPPTLKPWLYPCWLDASDQHIIEPQSVCILQVNGVQTAECHVTRNFVSSVNTTTPAGYANVDCQHQTSMEPQQFAMPVLWN